MVWGAYDTDEMVLVPTPRSQPKRISNKMKIGFRGLTLCKQSTRYEIGFSLVCNHYHLARRAGGLLIAKAIDSVGLDFSCRALQDANFSTMDGPSDHGISAPPISSSFVSFSQVTPLHACYLYNISSQQCLVKSHRYVPWSMMPFDCPS